MLLVDSEPVFIKTGTSWQSDYSLPDDCLGIAVRLSRYTSLRPELWASEKTIVKLQVSLYQNGNLVEAFSPDEISGGIGKGKDGKESPVSGHGFPLMPLLCDICGARFHPNQQYVKVQKNMDSPDYLGEGLLSHSTIALRQGKDLAAVIAATDQERLKQSATINDFKTITLPGWKDKEIFDRTFHEPVCVDKSGRSILVTIEVLSGPDLVTEISVEST